MDRILVIPVGRGAPAREAGVPDDLAERGRAMVVVGVEGEGEAPLRVGEGDVVLMGEGDEVGIWRVRRGLFAMAREGEGAPLARGTVIGILRKFRE